MLKRHEFDDGKALAAGLAASVANNLKAGIDARGKASLAVSGGSTPAKFFQTLGADGAINWSKVIVTLVDERWVPDTSDRSNARLVKTNLLQGPAAAAEFVPLYGAGELPTLAEIAKLNTRLEALPETFDAVVLGMGNDGHTASFFPGGDALQQALTEKGPAIAIEAPGAGEPRVTLTLPRLLATQALYLHIEGQSKMKVLEQALETGPKTEMPVRAVLRQTSKDTQLYWCP